MAYRRPSNPRVPGTILALLIVLAGGAAGFGLSRLSSDPERVLTTTASTDGTPVQAAPPPPRPAAPAPPAATGKSSWPRGLRRYTVVLSTATDEVAARAEAKKATDDGVEEVGVLFGRDHAGLDPNLYVVFAGRYKKDVKAKRNAARLAPLGYGDAYPRLIEPR